MQNLLVAYRTKELVMRNSSVFAITYCRCHASFETIPAADKICYRYILSIASSQYWLHSLLDGVAGPADRSLNGAGISRTCASEPTDDGEPDESYGTLMFSQGGQSKYLGPTAGSVWLRDVRDRSCRSTS